MSTISVWLYYAAIEIGVVCFYMEVKCNCKDATKNLQTNPLLKCGKAFKLCRLKNHARKLSWLSASTELAVSND